MDAHSGEILAYTSLPDFDPNEFQSDTPHIDPKSLIEQAPHAGVRAGLGFQDLLPVLPARPGRHPGRPAFLQPRLSTRRSSPTGKLSASADLAAYGDVTPQQHHRVLLQRGRRLRIGRRGHRQLLPHAHALRIRQADGTAPPGGNAGLLRKPVSQWSARSKPTIAMGQEVSVSAIQVMAAASAIANGGVLLKPLIVKKIVSPQGAVMKEFGREPLWEAVSPDSSAPCWTGWRRPRSRLAAPRAAAAIARRAHLCQDRHGPGGQPADRHLFGQGLHRLDDRDLPDGGPAVHRLRGDPESQRGKATTAPRSRPPYSTMWPRADRQGGDPSRGDEDGAPPRPRSPCHGPPGRRRSAP